MLDKLMPLLTQGSNLDIKELVLVSKEREDGVVISMTSPDPDGKKMAQLFAQTFQGLAEMMEAQGVKIIFSHLDIDGNEL